MSCSRFTALHRILLSSHYLRKCKIRVNIQTQSFEVIVLSLRTQSSFEVATKSQRAQHVEEEKRGFLAK